MLTNTNNWFRRMHFPASGAELGWGMELWLSDPSGYEGYEQLRARIRSLLRRHTPRRYTAELSRNLLSDVLFAVGGVEQARADFHAAVDRAQVWADEHAALRAGVPSGIQNEDVVEAWYEFANVLTWARAVQERIDRRGAPRRQGLLPAIKPKRLKKRVTGLFEVLKAGPMHETRWLANRTLHEGLVRNAFSGADLDGDGHVLLPIPAPIMGAIYSWDAFTWNAGRDAGSFVDELWATIVTFMDGLLDAYEKATPKRLRR